MSPRPVTNVPRTVPPVALRRTLLAVRRFRLNFLFGVLLLVLGLLLARLGKIQLADSAHYAAEAQRRQGASYALEPRRGRILDRHGEPLAVPKAARRLGVDPSVVDDPRTFAIVLSEFLGGAPAPWSIREAIAAAHERARNQAVSVSRYEVLVARTHDPVLVARLDELAAIPGVRMRRLGLYGAVVHPLEDRHVPNGDYAAHVIGRPPRPDGTPGTGAEQAFDADLTGAPRRVALLRDARRRGYAAEALPPQATRRGLDVHLTIDLFVQHVLERALDDLVAAWHPQQACGIVVDPHSGHLLALAGRPNFDPAAQAATLNPAIQGLYEPGSLFKPFTVAWALGHGAVAADELLEMPASVLLPHERVPIRDTHHVGPGTVVRLLAESSNTGAAELADRLGCDRMRALFERLFPPGGGAGCGLPYEAAAGPRLEAWPWWLAHRASYGQGFRVTPLALASAFAGFAREDARVVQPRIARDDPRPPAPGPTVCALGDLAVVRAGLEACAREGTAARVFAGAPYAVAAKTGTAQQWGTLDGRRVLLANCSVAAYAPADRPQVVVLVLAQIDDGAGGYGGSVAGPAVRTVLDAVLRYWRVLPGAAGVPALALAEEVR